MKNTSLCYIEHDGKFLMMYRNKKENDENEGKYIGLGGKFLENESPYECVCREVYEEAELKLINPVYRGVVTFVSDSWESQQMHLFYADRFFGSPCECDEGELMWVDKDKIFDLPLWEGDKIFLELMLSPIPFFSLKLEYKGDELVGAFLDGKPIDKTTPKTPILVSACLLGVCCRYDGKSNENERIKALRDKYDLIPFCPEQLGGLTTPRLPSEILNEKVVMKDGRDVTGEYQKGANEALGIARIFGARAAILKENSPSCGTRQIHSGKFDGELTDGMGICAKTLKDNGIFVVSENEAELYFK